MTLLHRTRAWFALLSFILTARRATRRLERLADTGVDVRADAAELDALLSEALRAVDDATTA
ncbi:hypothetical protein [Phycicoccus sp.]|uniref:hypothetical protein n=1 Tax=Phycicoccus sp. TaxID=1902410 RepID=UPI002C113994|nr:hypothetical protein [Phycicoccus sp.]HMM93971.1 hypothetical protein [Phycicoccus sp.]